MKKKYKSEYRLKSGEYLYSVKLYDSNKTLVTTNFITTDIEQFKELKLDGDYLSSEFFQSYFDKDGIYSLLDIDEKKNEKQRNVLPKETEFFTGEGLKALKDLSNKEISMMLYKVLYLGGNENIIKDIFTVIANKKNNSLLSNKDILEILECKVGKAYGLFWGYARGHYNTVAIYIKMILKYKEKLAINQKEILNIFIPGSNQGHSGFCDYLKSSFSLKQLERGVSTYLSSLIKFANNLKCSDGELLKLLLGVDDIKHASNECLYFIVACMMNLYYTLNSENRKLIFSEDNIDYILKKINFYQNNIFGICLRFFSKYIRFLCESDFKSGLEAIKTEINKEKEKNSGNTFNNLNRKSTQLNNKNDTTINITQIIEEGEKLNINENVINMNTKSKIINVTN